MFACLRVQRPCRDKNIDNNIIDRCFFPDCSFPMMIKMKKFARLSYSFPVNVISGGGDAAVGVVGGRYADGDGMSGARIRVPVVCGFCVAVTGFPQ